MSVKWFNKWVCAKAGEIPAAVYVPFCAFASLIIAQKSTTTTAQLSKALKVYEISEPFLSISIDYQFIFTGERNGNTWEKHIY